MYKIYFRQAIQMLRQNMVMSIIAILGTALAIMMIMTIIVTEEIKNASVEPEANRYRTYYADGHMEKDSAYSTQYSGSMTYEIIHDYLSELKEPEVTSVFSHSQKYDVRVPGTKDAFSLSVRNTDAAYWKVMTFSIIKGRTFTEEEFQSGVKYAVISETKAKEMFKDEEVINKTLEIQLQEYQIIGIVNDVNPLFSHASGNIWIPYTSVKNYEKGSYLVAMLAKSIQDFPAIYREFRSREKMYISEKRKTATLSIRGPYNHRTLIARFTGFSEEEIKDNINILNRKRILILVILLLVPALNLSGISLSRIKKRASEIGVRKAFGAKKYVILIQVLYENFITSLIGGILGLILSYVVVFQMKTWLLQVPGEAGIPLNTLISPAIFIAVFFLCLVINLLSAGLPALRASRITIINSINQNDR